MDNMCPEHQLVMSVQAVFNTVMTAIVEVMKGHKIDVSVQEDACKALNLLVYANNHQDTLERTRGLEMLVSVMATHRTNLCIQENAAAVMLRMTCKPGYKNLISRVGDIDAIMEAMFVCPIGILEHRTIEAFKTALHTYDYNLKLTRPITRSIFSSMKMHAANPHA